MDTTKDNCILQTHLCFEGRCEEAIEFYRRALGAEVVMMLRFKDSPEPPQPGMCAPGSDNKIMHAQLRIGGTVVMASDGRCSGKASFSGFTMSVSVPTEAEADQRFNALADGGQIQMPLAKTFFSKRFGMVVDRFGVSWMVLVRPPETK